MNKQLHLLFFTAIFFFVAGCKKDSATIVTPPPTGKDPNTAEVVSIDRFSSTAGNLYVRTATNGMPAANAAVNFDVAPFITHGI
ncbi:MAG: putative lipoprotein, partial [Stygiobacter sp.]